MTELEKATVRAAIEPFNPDSLTDADAILQLVRDWPTDERKAFQRELRRLVSLAAGLDPGALVHPDEIILRYEPPMVYAAAVEALK